MYLMYNSSYSVNIKMSVFRRELSQWLRSIENNSECKVLVTKNDETVGVLISPDLHRIYQEARLKQRGAVGFDLQLKKAGGLYTADEVSHILDVTKNYVDEKTGCVLLGIQVHGVMLYPCWQFEGNKLVDNFPEVMALLDATSVSIIQFFLTYVEELNKSPIEALINGNDLATVIILAQQFQQHIAR